MEILNSKDITFFYKSYYSMIISFYAEKKFISYDEIYVFVFSLHFIEFYFVSFGDIEIF